MIRGNQAVTAHAGEAHSCDTAAPDLPAIASCDTLQAFGGAIVHDLNNVLTAVIGNLSLLREDRTGHDATLTAIVDEALAAGRRGAYLVEAVEALTGQLRLSPEPTDVNRLIFAAMTGLRMRLNRLELRTHLSPAPVPAQVDGAMLRRAVTGTAMCLTHEVCTGAHTLTIEARAAQSGSGTGFADIMMTCECESVREDALDVAHQGHRSRTLLRDDEWRLASVAGFLAQSGGRMATAVRTPGQARITLRVPAAADMEQARDSA